MQVSLRMRAKPCSSIPQTRSFPAAFGDDGSPGTVLEGAALLVDGLLRPSSLPASDMWAGSASELGWHTGVCTSVQLVRILICVNDDHKRELPRARAGACRYATHMADADGRRLLAASPVATSRFLPFLLTPFRGGI